MKSMANPDAPRRPVRKTIGSVSFQDPYDWLQRDTDEALAWQWQQDAVAEQAARSIPFYGQLKQQIAESTRGSNAFVESPPRLLGKKWFRTGADPTSGGRTVFVGDRIDDPGRAIASMAALAEGQEVASAMVMWYEPSPNGEFVAMMVCASGAMLGEWRVAEVATGKVLDIRIAGPGYTGAVPGWLPDAGGFYFNDRADDGRHRLRFQPVKPGVAARAEIVFDYSIVPANVSGLTPEVSPDGRFAIGLAGPHERIAYVLGDLTTGRWRRFLPEGFAGECSGSWLDERTYVARVHTDDYPRGRIVAIPVTSSTDESSWREIEPQRRAVLRAVAVMSGRIVVCDVLDVSARFRSLKPDGSDERVLPLAGPGSSMIAMIFRRFDSNQQLTFDYQTFVQSSAIYHADLATSKLTILRAAETSLHDIRVTQHFATSLDGTRVPYFVVQLADLALDKPRPALVTAYGGFNVALMPTYLAHLVPFVRAGGVFIHANLRGGAEYGKQWHESGRLACKWNVFLDLFAVAEKVIADGVTTPELFAMMGGSNGGLLAGVAIVHRPDLWRVVVPVVPIFDQLEPLPLDEASAPVRAIFYEDYGDPSHPAMSKVLYSYSPYHNLREGVAYPAVFQVFGEKDLGCMPFHGRKFTAALLHATSSGRPVHLRVWKNTGHGSLDPAVAVPQAAEWVGFVMHELGLRPA